MSDDFTLPDGRVVPLSANTNSFERAHKDFGIQCKYETLFEIERIIQQIGVPNGTIRNQEELLQGFSFPDRFGAADDSIRRNTIYWLLSIRMNEAKSFMQQQFSMFEKHEYNKYIIYSL